MEYKQRRNNNNNNNVCSLVLRAILCFILVSFSTASTAVPQRNDPHDNSSDEAILSEVITWLEAKGSWISPKIEIKQLQQGLSTILANAPLRKGEVVADIPWHAILAASTSEDSDWCDQVQEVRRAISKAPQQQTPYERYLAKRSRDHIPLFWSDQSKTLLSELMEGFVTKQFLSNVEELWKEECGMPIDDKLLDAMMLLQTRGEGELIDLLVPFGDLLNHRNGKYTNVDPVIDKGKKYKIVAIRDVQAGEELQNSYNKCKWCHGLYANAENPSQYYVTPQLFEIYGFIEAWPQRWILPEARLFFDIEEGEKEQNLQVKFVAPPSPYGLDFLEERLEELKAFQRKLLHIDTDIPQPERNGLSQLHEAVTRAFKLAHEQAYGQVSNEVWRMGRYWHRDETYQQRYHDNYDRDSDEL